MTGGCQRLSSGLVSGRAFSGGPGWSPIMPGCLQVPGDVCKATPFVPLSPLLLLLLSGWLTFLPLKCLKTWDIFICSVSTWIWSSVSIGDFLRDCIPVFKGVSDEDYQVYMCVSTLCSLLWFLMATLLCLATIWFKPAAILLELDFLSLCLETRILRNTHLDHL